MAAAQAGDAVAYRKLLEDILPVVRRQVRARLFDPSLAEDVVQNALLNVHRARHTYHPERPFAPWLGAIVRNAVIDSLRERGRRVEREFGVDDFDGFPHASTEPDLDAGDTRLPGPLVEALESLPAAQRQAVELIQLRGLSVAAAAAEAGVSTSALKVRAHRGYRALRAHLERNGGLE